MTETFATEMTVAQVFSCPDGTTFDNKADALNYLRKPLVKAAMLELTDGQEDIATWLVENQDAVESSFETGTIKRVTKAEHKKLKDAVTAMREISDKRIEFLQTNYKALVDSFRWPAVKRMKPEEKEAQAKMFLVQECNNPEMADWIIANQVEVMEAYKAGIPKREISQKALDGLAAYKERKAAEKAAAEAEVE
jgi:dsDNA-binding SOS-regulon protein